MAHDIDEDSGRPLIKVNHPAPADVVRNPAHLEPDTVPPSRAPSR
jgi:hypothetical protein